jgi:hypothetical protein
LWTLTFSGHGAGGGRWLAVILCATVGVLLRIDSACQGNLVGCAGLGYLVLDQGLGLVRHHPHPHHLVGPEVRQEVHS